MKVPIAPLDTFWLTEAVRLREEQGGQLDDSEARRHAIAQGGDLQQRILTRAYWLARRERLLDALASWRQSAQLAMLIMTLLACFAGASLSFAALGDGQRPVNIFWALTSLLGLNLLMLCGWLAGLLFGGGAASALGKLWLWLSNKLSRNARSVHLAPALMVLLGRQRLTRWLLGLLVHGFWTVAMIAALALMLTLLSTRRYGFVWETTILDPQTFVIFTRSLGSLPAWLGFPLPDAALIEASGDQALTGATARHIWAGWLVGVTLVYGLLPRLVLWLVCFGCWRRGRRQLQLDLNDPAYRLLGERLMPPSERLEAHDLPPAQAVEPVPLSPATTADGAVLVAIELDDRRLWPPPLPPTVHNAGVLDESKQRHRLLQQLTQHPAARLVIAIDPGRSPDRGTLMLLTELSHCAAATRIWLTAAEGETVDPDRLGDWQAALDRLELPYDTRDPLTWLATGDD